MKIGVGIAIGIGIELLKTDSDPDSDPDPNVSRCCNIGVLGCQFGYLVRMEYHL
jgi:hypothetical protein